MSRIGVLRTTGILAIVFCALWSVVQLGNLTLSGDDAQQQMTAIPLDMVEQQAKPTATHAIFLQMGTNFRLFDELKQCVSHVAGGLPNGETLDVHVALLEQDAGQASNVTSQLSSVERVSQVHVVVTENAGADVGQFLTQLKQIADKGVAEYGTILKIHAKSDDEWRRRITESLCGSPNQVYSIVSALRSQNIQMVAPLGTAFDANTPVDRIYPRIIDIYGMTSAAATFDPKTVEGMTTLYRLLMANERAVLSQPRVVAGSSWWIKWKSLEVEKWMGQYEKVHSQLTRGYTKNLGVEHFIERLIPTMVSRIAEITPAPRVFAMYFPQYHAFPQNDRFWGVNFTEWTLLKPFEADPPVRKPLPEDQGGLGYYNLLDLKTRQRQAELAKEYGVTGFAYYHYWFSGSHAPENHLVMTGLFDSLMKDGEPNLPFFLSWANEPWNRRWTGQNSGEILLSQEYGDEEEWREHFMYLLKFFQHPNYEKVDGRPVFAMYRPGHIGERFAPMVELWQGLARENGFPGLHIVQTVGNFYETDKQYNFAKGTDIQASFQFWPLLWGPMPQMKGPAASVRDADLKLPSKPDHVQYWGSYTTFDRRPRTKDFIPLLVTPNQFDKSLSDSFRAMSAYSGRRVDKNLFFVTAWNEWNEQALLEPDDTYKFGFLEALQENLRRVPVSIMD